MTKRVRGENQMNKTPESKMWDIIVVNLWLYDLGMPFLTPDSLETFPYMRV